MDELQTVRQTYRVKIRQQRKDKQNLQNRAQLIQFLQNFNTFTITMQDFVMSVLYKQYSECQKSIIFFSQNINYFDNDQIREQAYSLSLVEAFITLLASSYSELVKLKLFELILVLSEFNQFQRQILPHCKRILDAGQDVHFGLSCIIFGNMMKSQSYEIRTSMLNFVINQDLESKICLQINSGKKYPLQHWLKFCIPYRSIFEQMGYNSQTNFFLRVEELCRRFFMNQDEIVNIDELILSYLAESQIATIEESKENALFIIKLSQSKYVKPAFRLLEKYSRHELWINDKFFNLGSILTKVITTSNREVVSDCIRLAANIIKNSQNESLAEYLVASISKNEQFKYFLKNPYHYQTQVAIFVKQIFILLNKEDFKLKLIRLLNVEAMNPKNKSILYGLTAGLVTEKSKRIMEVMDLD